MQVRHWSAIGLFSAFALLPGVAHVSAGPAGRVVQQTIDLDLEVESCVAVLTTCPPPHVANTTPTGTTVAPTTSVPGSSGGSASQVDPGLPPRVDLGAVVSVTVTSPVLDAEACITVNRPGCTTGSTPTSAAPTTTAPIAVAVTAHVDATLPPVAAGVDVCIVINTSCPAANAASTATPTSAATTPPPTSAGAGATGAPTTTSSSATTAAGSATNTSSSATTIGGPTSTTTPPPPTVPSAPAAGAVGGADSNTVDSTVAQVASATAATAPLGSISETVPASTSAFGGLPATGARIGGLLLLAGASCLVGITLRRWRRLAAPADWYPAGSHLGRRSPGG